MANISIDSRKKRTYDAIVIGSGASGGWAAKELCDKGLKTLLLDRGRNVKHIDDYPTASKAPWEFEFRGTVPLKQRVGYENHERLRAETLHWMLKDDEQPFIAEKPYRWFRAYHVGGKSLLWARQTQRWSNFDFEAPARDGFAVDWPIRYRDVEPWYAHVEKFAGISGKKDGLGVLPDSEVMPAFELNCVEEYFKETLKEHYGSAAYPYQAGADQMHESEHVQPRLCAGRIFQQQLLHHSLGFENREPDHASGCCGSLYYL